MLLIRIDFLFVGFIFMEFREEERERGRDRSHDWLCSNGQRVSCTIYSDRQMQREKNRFFWLCWCCCLVKTYVKQELIEIFFRLLIGRERKTDTMTFNYIIITIIMLLYDWIYYYISIIFFIVLWFFLFLLFFVSIFANLYTTRKKRERERRIRRIKTKKQKNKREISWINWKILNCLFACFDASKQRA